MARSVQKWHEAARASHDPSARSRERETDRHTESERDRESGRSTQWLPPDLPSFNICDVSWHPLSSEYGTYKTVNLRFGPWLSGERP
jgi:hypothetical protein